MCLTTTHSCVLVLKNAIHNWIIVHYFWKTWGEIKRKTTLLQTFSLWFQSSFGLDWLLCSSWFNSTPCAALCLFYLHTCVVYCVTSKRYFPQLFFFFPPDWSAHEEVLLAASSERWPGLGRIPARLSCWPQFFHAVINAADNAALRGSFSQDPQHTATHSDGVTRTFATEPPLSEAQRAARPGSAAAPHISGSLRQAAHHWYRWRRECVCANLETRWKCLRKRNEVIWKGALEEMQPKVRLEKLSVASNTPQFSQIIAAPGTFLWLSIYSRCI